MPVLDRALAEIADLGPVIAARIAAMNARREAILKAKGRIK